MFLTVIVVLISILALCAGAALYSLARGPELPHRVISIDTMATLMLAAGLLLSLTDASYHALDAVLVLALIGFLGTVAYSRYIEKGVKRDEP